MDAVSSSKLFKNPSGKKWLVFYMKKFSFTAEEMVNEDDKLIKNKITAIIEKVKPEIDELIDLVESIEI